MHAWACWRVVQEDRASRGRRDTAFLKRAFQKLLLNFTWWVNRKDPDGRNLFSGGFLGLDNIGVFDRSKPLPTGGQLTQADGTAWTAFFCTTMLSIALELAQVDEWYEDIASKFFEHFVAIVDATNAMGGQGLWDEEDGFYYDQLLVDGQCIPMRVRSMVGLIPLFAAEVLGDREVDRLPGFSKRDAVVPGKPARAGGPRVLPAAGAREPERACSPSPRASGWSGSGATCWTSASSSRHTASGASPGCTARTLYVLEGARRAGAWSTTPGDSSTGIFGGNSELAGSGVVPPQLPPRRGARAGTTTSTATR